MQCKRDNSLVCSDIEDWAMNIIPAQKGRPVINQLVEKNYEGFELRSTYII